jgi:predicted NAD/FAD-binding protein
MNRLQRLDADRHYVVTLNRRGPIRDEHVIREMVYTHPRYTLRSMATQPELAKLNGRRHTWFCGSYFGWGFHEDAVVSGAAVARDLGVEA